MAEIRYQFVASGQNDVKAAFGSIDAAARAADRSTKQRATSSRTALTAEEKRYREVEKYAARAEQQLKREADTAVREAKRAGDGQVREAKRAADAKIKAHEHVFQIHARYDAEQKRMEARASAAQARASAAQARAASRAGAMLRASNASDLSRNDERFGALHRGASRFAFGAAAALGAGLGVVGGAAREGMRLQDASSRLAINARGAGQEAVDAATLRREFESAATANPGVKAADLAEGAQEFVAKTGDLATARRLTSTFATTASATGADVKDIAATSADLSLKFNITGIEEMRSALAALTFQGKAGAFELKDAASQFAKMGAAAERFGISKGVEGVKTLGGLAQLARSSTGSAAQASTSVEAMFRQLIAKSTVLKGMGVDVFEKGSNSKTRDIKDVLTDLVTKTKGSTKAVQDILLDRGIRADSRLLSTFNEAKDATKGSEEEKLAAGARALREALDKAINAPGDWAEMIKDATLAQQTAGAQLEGAWERLKAQVAEKTLPTLVNLVPKLTGLVDAMDPLIDLFGALAEGVGGLVTLLKAAGLIADHTEGRQLRPKEELKALNAELAAASGSAGPLTADQQQDLAGKRARVEELSKALGITDQGAGRPLDTFLERYGKENDIGPLRQYEARQAMETVGDQGADSSFAATWASRLNPFYSAETTSREGGLGGMGGGSQATATPTVNTAPLQGQLDALSARLAALKLSPSVIDGK